MASPTRTAVIGMSLATLAVGSGLASYATANSRAAKPAPAATPTTSAAFADTARCAGCPANISLDSVEVQAREGSTLFIVRGKWPESADKLTSNVRLVANDVELVLKPHGSQNAFELATANRGAGHPTGAAVGAGISGGALLINISPALSAPVSFEFGLWDGTAYTGRIPRSGLLAWSGAGAPTHPAVSVAPAGSDLTSLVGACQALPNTKPVPSYLEPKGISTSLTDRDPRTSVPTPKVGMLTGTSALDSTAPFTIVAVIGRAGGAAPAGQPRAIDRVGTTQLYLYFDGTTKHKGIRTLAAGRWSMDTAADNLTYVLNASSLSFYWPGLKAGDSVGFVTADGAGCRTQGVPFGSIGGAVL